MLSRGQSDGAREPLPRALQRLTRPMPTSSGCSICATRITGSERSLTMSQAARLLYMGTFFIRRLRMGSTGLIRTFPGSLSRLIARQEYREASRGDSSIRARASRELEFSAVGKAKGETFWSGVAAMSRIWTDPVPVMDEDEGIRFSRSAGATMATQSISDRSLTGHQSSMRPSRGPTILLERP